MKKKQYIGLEDQNGKKIHEGDIYISHYLDELRKQYPAVRKEKPVVVKWEKTHNWAGYELLDSVKYIEVVGSIYENKELIK